MDNFVDEKTIGGVIAGILAIGGTVLAVFKRKNNHSNGNGNGQKVHTNTLLLRSIDATLKELGTGQKVSQGKLDHMGEGIENLRIEFAELKGRLSV